MTRGRSRRLTARSRPRKEMPFGFAMMLRRSAASKAVRSVETSSIPRGYPGRQASITQPTFTSIFSVGVCVAIRRWAPSPVPCGRAEEPAS